MSAMTPTAATIERQELWQLQQAASAEQRQLLGLRCFQLPSQASLVSIAAALPSSAIVINRCLELESGLPGIDPALSGDESGAAWEELKRRVQTAINRYRELSVQRFFLQLPAAALTPELHALLQQQGLQRARGWQEFERGAEPLPPPVRELATDIDIRPIGAEWGAEFARIACAAFDLVVPGQDAEVAAATEAWIAQVASQPSWQVFMAFCEGEPAGVGALFRVADYGWCNFGATSPRFRGRGIQQALLRARLGWGLQQGLRGFYTCTGVAVPGDPQHSWNNILKVGFRPTHIRENYQPQQ